MLTCLTLSFVLGAPVPAGAAPDLPVGPAPRIVVLKPDAEGAIRVPVSRAGRAGAAAGVIVVGGGANPNGGQIVIQGSMEATPVPLTEVKDLAVTTADGKKVEVADAAKRLAKGGVVVVSADGKPVDPQHLKLFKGDVLVLVAPELVPPAAGGVGNFVIPNLQIQLQPAAPLPAPVPPGK
jgi:hypothetical protein